VDEELIVLLSSSTQIMRTLQLQKARTWLLLLLLLLLLQQASTTTLEPQVNGCC
jgi:hypothetical protein